MRFRPFPVLTAFAAPALAALVWLGVWQSGRAEWKAALIADYERQAAGAPEPLEAALCAGDPAGRIVPADAVAALTAGHEPGLRIFGPDPDGGAGWRALTAVTPPACIAQDGPLLVQTGFEPIPGAVVRRRPPVTRYTVVAWPPRGMMEAENAPSAKEFHWWDAPAMAAALGEPKVNSRFYLAPFSGQLPDALNRTPPATHYGYAATWFGLAIALVVIYGALHARAGRLRFGPDKTS